MLTLLLFALGLCQESYLALHFAVSNRQTESLAPYYHGPRPRFTTCSHCVDVAFALPTHSGSLSVDPKPILRIDRRQIASSAIEAATPVYHPETRVYSLYLFPNEEISERLARIVEGSRNELLVRMSCSQVTDIGRVGPVVKRSLRAGRFKSEREARELARHLEIHPKMIPFDAEMDERHRLEWLRAALGEYAGLPNQRQQIRQREPELHRFLENHPRYWSVLVEVEEEMEQWSNESKK